MEEINCREQAAALEQAVQHLDMQPPQQLIGEVLFGHSLAPQQLQKLSEAQAALAELADPGGKEDADVPY